MTTATPVQDKQVCLASAADRLAIYRLRHDIFAQELGQHPVNEDGVLTDALDDINLYLVVKRQGEICGHISLTPPTLRGYSIEKYVHRNDLPFQVDDKTYEARLLTVRKDHRGTGDALLLMYAAYSWVRHHGGTQVMALGRREVLPLYVKSGFASTGMAVRSGAVDYEIVRGTLETFALAAKNLEGSLRKALTGVRWELPRV